MVKVEIQATRCNPMASQTIQLGWRLVETKGGEGQYGRD